MSLLRARGLTLSLRRGGADLPVLRNLTFALNKGQVLGLVGESGAGKSMIGRMVSGHLPPGFSVTGGTLDFAGHDLLRPHRTLLGDRIAFIPQEPMTALNPVQSIGSQFDEHLARLRRPHRREAALEALAAVQLPNPAEILARYPHQLSGGQCQRVLIAMAFASNPALVVADEPTTALDVSVQARIIELMRSLQEAHRTAILFITHDLRLAAETCDAVAVLYAGRIVEHGTVAEVFAEEGHPYTRCLHLANPPVTGARRPLLALPDQMPGLQALAAQPGCAFAPRCPAASAECAGLEPPLRPLHGAPPTDGASHRVACHHPERTAAIAPATDDAPPTAPPGADLLTLEALGKTFVQGPPWRRRATPAVRGVSLTVREGEFLAVVGESGSGKSTLGRLVVGLETGDAGRITLAGTDITRPTEAARRHRLAHVRMVFQDPTSALNPRQRVADIVTQSLIAAGAPPAERHARAAELLAEMGMPAELAVRVPHQLSGGQRQRVNIARALCTVPKLLVADEIVSGLDVSIQAQLLTLLARLRRELGFALLFITHDLGVVRHLCDTVVVMHQGEIVERGTVETVFASPAHPYTQRLLAAVPPDLPG